MWKHYVNNRGTNFSLTFRLIYRFGWLKRVELPHVTVTIFPTGLYLLHSPFLAEVSGTWRSRKGSLWRMLTTFLRGELSLSAVKIIWLQLLILSHLRTPLHLSPKKNIPPYATLRIPTIANDMPCLPRHFFHCSGAPWSLIFLLLLGLGLIC